MAALLGLLSALCYGASDFVAGVGGRRGDPSAVTILAQPLGLLAAVIGVLVLPGSAPSAAGLAWGALSGVGSGVGTVALYRGLARGRMSVVAPLSAVLAAALPALTGVLLGERLSWSAWLGIGMALPAVLMVSMPPEGGQPGGRRVGVVYGLVAGVGFAALFIGLARAGTTAGAWPLVPGQAVAVVIVAGTGLVGSLRPRRGSWAASWWLALIVGALAGLANLLYLMATGRGQLAVVAVLTALYPAVTVLLSRLVLHERWQRLQAAGLLIAAAAVSLITLG